MRKIDGLKVNEDGWEGWAVTVDGEIVAKVDQNTDGECEVHVFTDPNAPDQACDFEATVK